MTVSSVPAAHTHIDLNADQDPGIDHATVQDLMRLETSQAVEAARAAVFGPGDSPVLARPVPAGDDVRLLAIYGMGKRLAAQVLVQGRLFLYTQGTRHAAGVEKNAQTYLLHGITQTCVRLEREGEFRTLCIHPELGATQ